MNLGWISGMCWLFVVSASPWQYSDRYKCGVCMGIAEGADCSVYGACHVVNETSLKRYGSCEELKLCEKFSFPIKTPASAVDLRVTPGFGTKPYGTARISVITQSNSSYSDFDYTAQFKYKWTGNYLYSSLKSMSAGPNQIPIGTQTVVVNYPKQGAGVSGLLIADPCIGGSRMSCHYQKKFKTDTRTSQMLNAFGAHPDVDYWGMLGDLLYDQDGSITKSFFDDLTLDLKQKVMLTVPGNHDYWVMGTPHLRSSSDQYGNGYMQWYTPDSKAAEHLMPGSKSSPFNFSVDPQTEEIPAIDNHFYYTQIGNLGIVALSGAYDLASITPYMQESCAWLGEQYKSGRMTTALMVSHWDKTGLGCEDDPAPAIYDAMVKLPGCSALNDKKILKFFMGHTHCNVPAPHGHTNTGFMVAGQGMEGCGNYGFTVFDTTENMIRVWYFEVYSQDGKDTFDTVYKCINANGWRKCTSLATVWLNQTLA